MINWLARLWEDIRLAAGELEKSGFTLIPGYPFMVIINPEWIVEKTTSDSNDDVKQ